MKFDQPLKREPQRTPSRQELHQIYRRRVEEKEGELAPLLTRQKELEAKGEVDNDINRQIDGVPGFIAGLVGCNVDFQPILFIVKPSCNPIAL